MTRRTKLTITVVAAVLVVGVAALIFGPRVYRDVFAPEAAQVPSLRSAEESGALDETPDEPAAQTDAEALGEALGTDLFAGTWVITEGSEAGYRVDEVLNGTDVTVTGRTDGVTGEVTVQGLTIVDAQIEVDVASITTDSSSRDRYFSTQALRTTEHPTATFVLSEPVEVASAPVAGEVFVQDLTGELTLAGVTQTVTFSAEWSTDGTVTAVAGQIPISFADYGVTAPSLGFVSVAPAGFVEFELTLEQR